MSSAVDICNLALACLGDAATVASIEPPEGSAQAQHCAIFYPMARNTLLEMHEWSFATTCTACTLKSECVSGWAYAYARPADALKIIAVERSKTSQHGEFTQPPVEYACSASVDGTQVILCNEPEVSVRYIKIIEDAALFPPLFVMALSWHLAAMLAGPVLGGAEGSAQAQRCEAMAFNFLDQARTTDANHSDKKPRVLPGSIRARF